MGAVECRAYPRAYPLVRAGPPGPVSSARSRTILPTICEVHDGAGRRPTPLTQGPTRKYATIIVVTVPYRSYVLVSRDQIARNFRNVRSVVGPEVEVAAVVKADAYGHGALEGSRVLTAEGARWLAVSSVEEGVAIRRGGILDAKSCPRILVMGGMLPYECEA